MLADLAESGEFVYVRRTELRYGGEDGKGGLGIEPMGCEYGVDERVNGSVGVKGDDCFVIGATRVIDERGGMVKVKGDLDGIETIA